MNIFAEQMAICDVFQSGDKKTTRNQGNGRYWFTTHLTTSLCFSSEQLGLKRTTIVAKSNKLRSFRQFSGTAKMKCLISSLNSESDNCVLQVLNCSNVPFSLFYSCD